LLSPYIELKSPIDEVMTPKAMEVAISEMQLAQKSRALPASSST
jgi:hypothetical protein